MRFKVLAMLCLLLFAMPACALCEQGNVMDNLHLLENTVKKYQKSIKLPDTDNNTRAKEAAKEAARMFYSPEYQERINNEQERIKEEIFTDSHDAYKDYTPAKDTGNNLLSPGERIYIFISSSVPISTLRNYAQDVDTIGDPGIIMVMRGFVDGVKYMKPTLKFIHGIITKDRGCEFDQRCEAFNAAVYIDPLLFRRYGITSVPAIVYAKGIDVKDPGSSEGLTTNAKVEDEYTIYGDVSIEHALEKVNMKDRSRGLKKVLKKLKGGYYN